MSVVFAVVALALVLATWGSLPAMRAGTAAAAAADVAVEIE